LDECLVDLPTFASLCLDCSLGLEECWDVPLKFAVLFSYYWWALGVYRLALLATSIYSFAMLVGFAKDQTLSKFRDFQFWAFEPRGLVRWVSWQETGVFHQF
jgi:hypothetical protein